MGEIFSHLKRMRAASASRRNAAILARRPDLVRLHESIDVNHFTLEHIDRTGFPTVNIAEVADKLRLEGIDPFWKQRRFAAQMAEVRERIKGHRIAGEWGSLPESAFAQMPAVGFGRFMMFQDAFIDPDSLDIHPFERAQWTKHFWQFAFYGELARVFWLLLRLAETGRWETLLIGEHGDIWGDPMVYLVLLGEAIEIRSRMPVLQLVKHEWFSPPEKPLRNLEEFRHALWMLQNIVLDFDSEIINRRENKRAVQIAVAAKLEYAALLIKQLAEYVLRAANIQGVGTIHDVLWHWHVKAFSLYTNADYFVPTGEYRGSMAVNTGLMRRFAEKMNIEPTTAWLAGLQLIEALQDDFNERGTWKYREFAKRYNHRKVYPNFRMDDGGPSESPTG